MMTPTASEVLRFFQSAPVSPVQRIRHPLLDEKEVELTVKRDDLLDEYVSGNKWRKLKYNLITAAEQGFDTLLSFGGAHSNHIYAMASACKQTGFKCIGVIRAHPDAPLTPTLQYAISAGMQLHYVSREEYRKRSDPTYIEGLITQFGNVFVIPEGGSSQYALRGCAETMKEIEFSNDARDRIVAVACGTGGTLAGLLSAVRPGVRFLGFPVLKQADFLYEDIRQLLVNIEHSDDWELQQNYHFGGYAKIDRDLTRFMEDFFKFSNVELDPVYTGKMFYGLFDMIRNDEFVKGTSITAIHTGGLQGIAGMQDKINKLKEV